MSALHEVMLAWLIVTGSLCVALFWLERMRRALRDSTEVIVELGQGIAELGHEVEARDRALEQWERAFAPNRPLGVQFPRA